MRRPLAGPRLYLIVLLVALAFVAVWPSLLGWQLVSAYAALRVIPAELKSVQQLGDLGVRDIKSVAADRSGALFVVDGSSTSVVALPDGTSRSAMVLASKEPPAALMSPVAVALAPDGTLRILDSTKAVLIRLTKEGNFLGSDPVAPGGAALVIDAKSASYVSAPATGLVHKYLPDGTADAVWGDRSGAVALGDVRALAVVGERLYATRNGEILQLSREGRLAQTRSPTGAPASLAASPGGTLVTGDGRLNQVWGLDRDGATAARVAWGAGQQTLPAPRGLALIDNRLYVAYPDRIQVFQLGRPFVGRD